MVLLMVISIIVNWLVGCGIVRMHNYKRCILSIGIIFNLAILGYYKYAGFVVEIINGIFHEDLFYIPEVILPIGISFYTFQAISFIVDVYRGDVEGRIKLIDTALYISFFPQLIAGPIVKYKDIAQQIQKRSIEGNKMAEGVRRFVFGLAKKVMISNTLGACVSAVESYGVANMGSGMTWVASLAYTFQLYYDFSGYSDMAIGLGKMFGFDIPENFNYPYIAVSIREFWQRWHISLGTWFREYVYIPLGGNRQGKVKTYINLFAVFFLTGLWHGAGLNFVLWGVYHGIFIIVERCGLSKLIEKHKFMGRFYCFLVVHFGWVFFRTRNIVDALELIKKMLLPWRYTLIDINIWKYMNYKIIFMGICAVVGAGALQKLTPRQVSNRWLRSVAEAVFCIIILLVSIASIASNTYNPFIYFQF
ncbi:MAG: MBOAT family O-acyltransferase [Suilimivivens sp.]